MNTPHTISLDALLAVLTERVYDAGSYRRFAQQVGLTGAAWRNIACGVKPPGRRALEILGYVEEAPRFKKISRRAKKHLTPDSD